MMAPRFVWALPPEVFATPIIFRWAISLSLGKLTKKTIVGVLTCGTEGKVNFKLPVNARKFALFQRNLLLPDEAPHFSDDGFGKFIEEYAAAEPELIETKYLALMKETAEDFLTHMPPSTSSILDIGSGIAGVDLFFYHALNTPKLYLLDKTQLEDKVWYMFEEKPAFYSSHDIAKEVLTLNGVKAADIETIDARDDGVIPIAPKSIDAVVSTVSWGFMYPVKPYLASVVALLRDDGVVITDIRKGTDGEAQLAEFFDTEVIREQRKFTTLKCRLRT
jgi:SAM-dependent methyltransferase